MQEDPELKEAVLDWYKAWNTGDVDSILQMRAFGPGSVVIGTDPEEWWESPEQLAQVVRAAHEGGLSFRPGKVEAYREGEFGFVADRPTFILPEGKERAARHTAVLRKEADGWKFLQAHYSFGEPNEDFFGPGNWS